MFFPRRGEVGPRRHAQPLAGYRRPAPYPITPAHRMARVLLAPDATQTLLRRIEVASQLGTVLEWSHDANDLRPWHWPVHGARAGARMGAFVAASGLRVHIAEHGLAYPVCLHGRSGFVTRQEAQARLVPETKDGKKVYKFVCAHQYEADDCFYEVYVATTPAIAVRNSVFNPAFQFQAPPAYLYLQVDPDESDDEEPEAMGFSVFNLENPGIPAQIANSASLVETRALMSLNSAEGLKVDYLPALHRILQHCQSCDIVALPAAMRAHIRSGLCRRFAMDLEQDTPDEPQAGPSSGSRSSSGRR